VYPNGVAQGPSVAQEDVQEPTWAQLRGPPVAQGEVLEPTRAQLEGTDMSDDDETDRDQDRAFLQSIQRLHQEAAEELRNMDSSRAERLRDSRGARIPDNAELNLQLKSANEELATILNGSPVEPVTAIKSAAKKPTKPRKTTTAKAIKAKNAAIKKAKAANRAKHQALVASAAVIEPAKNSEAGAITTLVSYVDRQHLKRRSDDTKSDSDFEDGPAPKKVFVVSDEDGHESL